MAHRIPVILDTDIGMDVDDVWALAFLLCCPELDLRLVVSSTGDTHYGAAIAGKLLQLAKRLCPEATKWPDCAENRLLLDLLK